MSDLLRSAPDDIRMLLANVADMIRTSEKGMTAASDFLNPRELYFVGMFIDELKLKSRTAFFGGYDGAERKRLFVFPEYAELLIAEKEPREAVDVFSELSGETAINIVQICGSGFKDLCHRDYMGSVMALGVERRSIGDIAVSDDTAYVFTTSVIAELMCRELRKVGRDGVKVRKCENLPNDLVLAKKTVRLSDTISSPRLDCMAAALLNISREAAQTLIRSGSAEHNYVVCTECDRNVGCGDVLSFRGYGRFRIVAFGGLNRRGRMRFEAEKYV